MKKFVAALVFLTLMYVGVSAYPLIIEAWDRDTNTVIVPGAQIFINSMPPVADPTATTPYTFSIVTFQPGSWSVARAGYDPTRWQPISIQINTVTGTRIYRFYGSKIPDNPTPVELSSFTTTLYASNYVKIAWTTQSESNLIGYNVYRSETNNLSDALNITPISVSATNTSTTQTYSIDDYEVVTGHTYYYWLQSEELGGTSQFFGPVSETLESTETPQFNGVSRIAKNAYPNPFKTNTTITVDLKANETGTIAIFNVLGQVVRTFSVNQQGQHTINWDGRDSKGSSCSSGIYFYRFSTPTTSQTQKLIIVN